MLSIAEIYDLLEAACDNAQEDDSPVVNVPGLGDVDLGTVKKLKWNSVTFKRRSTLWFVTGRIVMIALYDYEMAYLINNSDKQAIILEMGGEKE